MKTKMNVVDDFDSLLIDAAITQIAVDDFENPEDYKKEFSDLQLELDRSKIALIDYVLNHPMLRILIASREKSGLDVTSLTKEDFIKVLTRS